MSQTVVSSFYRTKKRYKNTSKDGTGFNEGKNIPPDDMKLKSVKTKVNTEAGLKLKTNVELESLKPSYLFTTDSAIKSKAETKKKSVRGSRATKVTKNAKKSKQTTVTSFYQSQTTTFVEDTKTAKSENITFLENEKTGIKVESRQSVSKSVVESKGKTRIPRKVTECFLNSDFTSENEQNTNIKTQIPQSPKRNLPILDDDTPSKKKPHVLSLENLSGSEVGLKLPAEKTPSKTKGSCARKLQLDVNAMEQKSCFSVKSPNSKNISSPRKMVQYSPRKIVPGSPTKSQLHALIQQSRAKLLLSPKLDELKKSLESFTEKTSKMKEYESNPCKITAVISPSSPRKMSKPLTSKPAFERFSHLCDPDFSTLILPFKYKLLDEMFRSMDTVVSILNNRKEKITFEKVREGVQKMMKRNFEKTHLGQIVNVSPSAYILSVEKCHSISKKTGSDYEFVISPNLDQNVESTISEKSDVKAFVSMDPQCLMSRRNDFTNSLLKLVMKYHQDFLKKLNIPALSSNAIKRWHPQFSVDSVPDVESAKLPEPQEAKIYSAKDVLNKVKSFRNKALKIEKALQSVAEESTKSDVVLELKDISSIKPDTSKNALKGVCSDLLEKIRAREKAKNLAIMTRTPAETKRLTMMERIPKIVQILWHYFIAERKVAVPIDTAVEKIIHSFNSLTTPDGVKEHLKLITEVFSGWLTFIEIPKGVYIQIDKKRNITEMLDNFKY